MIASATTFVLGGLLHPVQSPNPSSAERLAAWIGDPMWIPSHTFILVTGFLLVPGLLGLLDTRSRLSTGTRRAGKVAVVAAALWAVESLPHLCATTESAAAAAGRPTPILDTHQLMSLLVHPLLGLSVATLAVLGGRRLTHRLYTVLAVIGGISWAVAPWAVGPLDIELLDALFPFGMLMAPWFAAVGGGELIRRHLGATEQAAT